MEIDFSCHDGVGLDGNAREEALLPVTLDGIADFGSRHFIHIADDEVGDVQQQFIVVAFDAIDGEAAKHVFGMLGGIDNFRFHLLLRIR